MSDRPSRRRPVAGSTSGRPIMVLLDLLGQRWTLRVLWELRDGESTFRALRARCDEISPSTLNARLKALRDHGLVALGSDGYTLTEDGQSLGRALTQLDAWAEAWAERD